LSHCLSQSFQHQFKRERGGKKLDGGIKHAYLLQRRDGVSLNVFIDFSPPINRGRKRKRGRRYACLGGL